MKQGVQDAPCLSLIGLPGAGRSTLAPALSRELGWVWIDTDHILEAWFGQPRAEIANRLGWSEFLRVEEGVILNLGLKRSIVSPRCRGLLSPRALQFLHHLGKIVYLQADPAELERRTGTKPDRHLILQPGQTLNNLYREGNPLYKRYADLVIRTDLLSPDHCLQEICKWFSTHPT